MKFIVGKKIEMSQRFKEDGTVLPVTLVYAPPVKIVQVKTKEKDGYDAVQIGAFQGKSQRFSKSELGHLKNLPAMSKLREFRLDSPSADFKKGKDLSVAQFSAGEKVDVAGISKGKGFQGVVKRHGFAGGPKSHGHKDQLRMPGAIGAQGLPKVFKGYRMGGHMGADNVTVKNLEIVEIDAEKNMLAIKGAIPGTRNSVVRIICR